MGQGRVGLAIKGLDILWRLLRGLECGSLAEQTDFFVSFTLFLVAGRVL